MSYPIAIEICQNILDTVATTNSLGDLQSIRDHRIPHVKGILDEERAELLKAVEEREEHLLAMMGIKPAVDSRPQPQERTATVTDAPLQ